jgi:hypothetical protein
MLLCSKSQHPGKGHVFGPESRDILWMLLVYILGKNEIMIIETSKYLQIVQLAYKLF